MQHQEPFYFGFTTFTHFYKVLLTFYSIIDLNYTERGFEFAHDELRQRHILFLVLSPPKLNYVWLNVDGVSIYYSISCDELM